MSGIILPAGVRVVCSIDGERFDEESITVAFERAVRHHHHKLLPGDKVKVYTGHVVEHVASDFLGEHLLDDLFEQMECQAIDEVGEVAEGFAYVTPADKATLLKLLQTFVDNKLTVDFYGVKYIEEHELVVSAKDLEDLK